MLSDEARLGPDSRAAQDIQFAVERGLVLPTPQKIVPFMRDFQSLDWGHRTTFREALERHPQWTSELTFVNLYAWAPVQYPRWGEIEGHLVVSYDPGNTGQSMKFLPPIGPDPIGLMAKLHREHGAVFVRVSSEHLASVCESIPRSLTEHEHDYLYTADQVRNLFGGQASELRRRLKKLHGSHGDQIAWAAVSKDTMRDAHIVVERWLGERLASCKTDEDQDGKRDDAEACRRVLDRWSELSELRGYVIYVRGEPVSLAIGELIKHPKAPSGIVISHFEKSVLAKDLQGLPVLCFQMLCTDIKPDCVINRMQDAGVPGLKTWKQSWGPFDMGQKGMLGYRT